MFNLTQNRVSTNTQPLAIGDFSIRQDEDGRYCLNDLHKASGYDKKHQPAYFIRNQQTKDLIIEIENPSNGASANLQMPAVSKINDGKNNGTYVVKELVYSYAMWISAKFHLTVIRAYDAMVMQWQMNDRKSISPEQQALLHEIVDRRSKGERKIYAEMWSRHNRHFKIPRYSELLAIHFSDSVHYLETMVLKAKSESNVAKPSKTNNEIFTNNAKALAHSMFWVSAWWRCYSDAFRLLNPRMAGHINDHFIDGAFIASIILGQDARGLSLKILEDLPYDLNSHSKIDFFRNRQAL
ncbi:KilA-N domain-containing protein [Acinetobacter pollinis]|uniref:KilA-N domain-containing protein n=1 Tax=Acinetobacter pollinis TaxID=2605270 RepID=A0ABU6DQ48_9GAMM|nr:KilA-N domain-containing protein [Acinetobacter pollinis]MEB5475994.1 KilA-N domain-containing protein [Acinetobacter pollinis]